MKLPKRLIFLVVIILLIINILNLVTLITITGQSTSSGTINICFNHPPIIDAIPDQKTDHNSPFSLNITASDSDNDNFTFTDNTNLFNISTSGTILFTPTLAQVNNYTITIYAQDNFTSCPATGNKNFNIEIYNLAPNYTTTIPNQTWEENVILTGINLNNYFSDPENDTLSFTSQNGPNITINITASGNVSIHPLLDFYGQTWTLFIANDSLSTINSHNITLTLTSTTHICGDGTCNTDETCSDCSSDCGTCPATPPSSPSSGSRRTYPEFIEIITEISSKEHEITLPPEKKCPEQKECHPWPTSDCPTDQKQTRSCIKTNSLCKITETIEERTCICQPQWECTTWYPEACTKQQLQTRACLDINKCEKNNPYPTKKLCSEQLMQIKPSTNLFGLALSFTKNVPQLITKYPKTTSFTFIIIIILVIINIIIYKNKSKLKRYFQKIKVNRKRKKILKEKKKQLQQKIKQNIKKLKHFHLKQIEQQRQETLKLKIKEKEQNPLLHEKKRQNHLHFLKNIFQERSLYKTLEKKKELLKLKKESPLDKHRQEHLQKIEQLKIEKNIQEQKIKSFEPTIKIIYPSRQIKPKGKYEEELEFINTELKKL